MPATVHVAVLRATIPNAPSVQREVDAAMNFAQNHRLFFGRKIRLGWKR
jgi:hypothetical protein